jgi:predicted transcriptional regulator
VTLSANWRHFSQRREAVKELTEINHQSQREAAEILGVSQKTVDRDLGESNDSEESRNQEGTKRRK